MGESSQTLAIDRHISSPHSCATAHASQSQPSAFHAHSVQICEAGWMLLQSQRETKQAKLLPSLLPSLEGITLSPPMR